MDSMTELLSSKYYINLTPTYLAMRCSARKSNGEDCKVCSDVCPQGIYPEGKRKHPNWTQCLKCGICAANCPDRCITFPSQRVDNYMMAIGKSGETGIGCAEDDSVMSLTVSCLAAVSWEQMAYAALSTGLVISLRACAKCPRDGYKELIAENIEKLRFFLGDEVFAQKVRVLHEGDEYEPTDTGISRRELFNIFKNLPLDKAMRVMPELESTQESGLFYRAMLRDQVQKIAAGLEPSQRPKYRMKLPVFTDKCYNCSYCAKACPQKALRITQEGDKLLMTVDVWRCTGCGICLNMCKYEGMSAIGTMKVSTLGTVALKRVQAYLCEDCGKPRPKDAEQGVCSTCLNHRKVEKARQDRLARAAAEKAKREAEKAAAEAAAKEASETV